MLMRGTLKSILLVAAAIGASAAIVALAVPAQAVATPSVRCAVAKRKASITRLRAIDACLSKPPGNGTPPADPACVAAADQRFQRTFARIEAKGGCMPEGDEPVAARVVDQCESSLLRLLSGICQPTGSACSVDVPCCNLVCVISDVDQTGVCQ
jgi:hypothetical protein